MAHRKCPTPLNFIIDVSLKNQDRLNTNNSKTCFSMSLLRRIISSRDLCWIKHVPDPEATNNPD